MAIKIQVCDERKLTLFRLFIYFFYRDRNAKSKLITKGKTEELSRLK